MAKKRGRPKNKGGRPIELTTPLADEICNFIRLGSWMETAAQACGIHRETLREWLKRGNKWLKAKRRGRKVPEVENGFIDFVQKARKAAAESELIDLERIDKAAEQVWQAAAWRLERRYPKRWGKRDSVDVSVKNLDQIIETELAKLARPARQIQNKVPPTPPGENSPAGSSGTNAPTPAAGGGDGLRGDGAGPVAGGPAVPISPADLTVL